MQSSVIHSACQSPRGGIRLDLASCSQTSQALNEVSDLLAQHQLTTACCLTQAPGSTAVHVRLKPEALHAWMPRHDTLSLRQRMDTLNATTDHDLVREIWVALLGAPVERSFPGVAALASHIRVRLNIALAAQKTALAFKTEAAERPWAYWRDGGDDAGFILQPGRCLVDALTAATQPDSTGRLYDFSCYRATEYVILLGIALELKAHHPALLSRLQQLNEVHAVRSGQFHEVYLVEYGSMASPLPSHFYVPGDRLWFRNPDERSSDVMGYEGSWVIYMGGGLFSNFWERDRPYTLESKAIEIYHWRNGAYIDDQGLWHMDETVVAQQVAQTAADSGSSMRVLTQMLRMRDPQGVYAAGGCIDSTREYPRGVSADQGELVLPVF